MNDPTKGQPNGVCARTACDHTPAIHFNRGTGRYYCTPCARRINDVPQPDGQPLCDWPRRDQLDGEGLLILLTE